MAYTSIDVDYSKAIRTFFRSEDGKIKSYYQYKGILFKTGTIEYSGFIPLTSDELQTLIINFETLNSTEPEVIKLLEIKELKNLLNDISNLDDDEKRDIISDEFRVNKFNKVNCNFASDLCMFWCPYCNDIFFEKDIKIDLENNFPECPECNKIVQQTPIWILKNDTGQKNIVTPLTVWINKYDLGYLWKNWGNQDYIRCIKCDNGLLKKYISTDPAQIYISSRVVCDSCSNQYSLYSSNYSLTAPSENLSSPFIAKTYSRSSVHLNNVDLKEKLNNLPIIDLNYITEFSVCPSLKIKELILGFWFGLHIKRVIKAEKTGMELKTSGIFLKINDLYYADALNFLKQIYKENQEYIKKLASINSNDLQLKRTILHSIAHILWADISIYSGLNIENFDYIYDVTNNAVIVYERSQGGLGASNILTQNHEEKGEPLLLDFVANMRDTIKNCNCDDRCKYCLALGGCQEFNDSLNRFSLGPFFKLTEDDLGWGF